MTSAPFDKSDESPERSAAGSAAAMSRSCQHLLLRASRLADDALAEALVDCPVSSRHVAVLEEIQRHPGVNQTELVGFTGIDRSTLSSIVIRLTRQGIISRRRSRIDARAHVLLLTPRGVQLAKTLAPIVERVDKRLLSRVSKAHREIFLNCLEALSEGPNASGKRPR